MQVNTESASTSATPPKEMNAVSLLRDFDKYPYITRNERCQIADILERCLEALKNVSSMSVAHEPGLCIWH
jgi:hypothetical protein